MSLRDENPQIDADLELVITIYEKAMIKSRDADSVFVPFRRGLEEMANHPQSVQQMIDMVPLPSKAEGEGASTPEATDPTPLIDPDAAVDGSADALAVAMASASLLVEPEGPEQVAPDFEEKSLDWVSECIPCDFRVFTALDAEFFKDISIGWENAIDQAWQKLKKLEALLDEGDALDEALSQICQLGDAFKFQCVPDIQKMIFMLTFLLNRMELEMNVDLGILSGFLNSVLEPIFNEMASMLDLVDQLAVGPIQCIIDQLNLQAQNIQANAQATQEALTNPQLVSEGQQTEAAEEAARRGQEAVDMASLTGGEHDAAEEAAEQARANYESTTERAERAEQGLSSATQAVSDALNSASSVASRPTERLKELLSTAKERIQGLLDHLIQIIEGFLQTGADKWNENVSFAEGKRDLLTQIAMMKALIEQAIKGDISCGPESGDMTEIDVKRFVDEFQHPSESLEITIENGTIVARRHPMPTGRRADAGSSPDRSRAELGNVVARRPISSCLKTVTTDEANQVEHWISQLEEEV